MEKNKFMTTPKNNTITGVITNYTISIPLNGNAPKIKFQIKNSESIRNYEDILKKYSEEFIHECIGQKVEVTYLEPIDYESTCLILELNAPDYVEKEEI